MKNRVIISCVAIAAILYFVFYTDTKEQFYGFLDDVKAVAAKNLLPAGTVVVDAPAVQASTIQASTMQASSPMQASSSDNSEIKRDNSTKQKIECPTGYLVEWDGKKHSCVADSK